MPGGNSLLLRRALVEVALAPKRGRSAAEAPEAAPLDIEQRADYRRTVVVRRAQPGERPVNPDQRRRATVSITPSRSMAG